MWGIIPAAGTGSRNLSLVASRELMPVGGRLNGPAEHPRAVSEYLVDRMVLAGARKLCFVISPDKSDILEHYRAGSGPARICYAVQDEPLGLCDAIFRALPFIPQDEEVVVGMPDAVWFPEDGLARLPGGGLSFLLFQVSNPERFDAVLTDCDGEVSLVREIQVKQSEPDSDWIWGAFKMTGAVMRDLHALWLSRDSKDRHLGTLVNAWLERRGRAVAVRAGEAYLDAGTLNGHREALRRLGAHRSASSQGDTSSTRPEPALT